MIREASKNDVDIVYHLIQQLETYTLDYETFKNKYNAIIDSTNWYIYVFEENDEVMGCITLTLKNFLHHNNTTCEIVELIVDEHHRNKHVGKELIEYVENKMKEMGVEEIELSTSLWRKEAHRFYARQGFDNNHFTFIKKI